METTKIALFKGKKIRKTLFQKEWWFSVIDVIEALTDSSRPNKYWTAMKARVNNDDGFQLSTICRQLKLASSDGKKYETDCADTEGIFRIIQSVPSPKAEPFKRWLAKVGFERVQEIENPELATKRTRMLYKLKGYPEGWIEKRIKTGELARSYLPAGRQVDDFELIFTMLGERSTTEIHKTENSEGVSKLAQDAKRGGRIAGIAKEQLEKEIGRPVVSKDNFLPKKKSVKKLK